ncbi:hypothetical protein P20429_2262 [Pseudoalteromonas sp. BSi20429]|uniref:Uncharacterized protein n=1 Tax=Pseudoalteromonas arctica A 37-1-2 TaxID=1117313 RepID=A0A290S243_9GAMM|nr:hypothetical protein PARC_a1353 [Pseudoalteromonas arctica A 37-1-2]GAA68138.1 hypothetical protein P20429_2262 [Pseudoalteromonas sp. BSi20429]
MNIISVIMPNIIGMVIVFNVGKMGSFSKSGRVWDFEIARMK